MEQLKKAGRLLRSMKFAMILLLVLTVACIAGSVISQGEVMSYYTTYYSSAVAGAILLFGLDDVFHCWWFVVLALLLCLSLLSCNLLHFPRLMRQMKEGFCLEKCLAGWDGTETVRVPGHPEELFRRMGFRQIQTVDREGTEYRYNSRNRTGVWGAWATHLGMLIVIAGFGLGQLFQTVYTVYGVPGQTKDIGDTGYTLTINDFQILLREDDTVDQYLSSLTVSDGSESRSGETSVNSPLSLYGMKFYQNSTGWAATLEVYNGEELEQQEVLCAGEYVEVESLSGLEVVLSALYPDYYTDESGMPATRSSQLNAPAYLYTIYYQGSVLGMNVLLDGEEITVDDYTFIFRDPQPYTLIQVKRDPFSLVTAVGGILLLVGLLLAFYVRPEELWAMRQEDGSWSVAGRSRKGGKMFQDEIRRRGEQLQKKDEREGVKDGQQSVS